MTSTKNNKIIQKKKPSLKIFYEINKNYAITIAPNDIHQFTKNDNRALMSMDDEFRIQRVMGSLWKRLSPFNSYIRYILHVDISEPRNMNSNLPRIHFHGVIRFDDNRDIRKWLLKILPELNIIGIVDIDTIDDPVFWEKYCKKYDHITGVAPMINKLNWS